MSLLARIVSRSAPHRHRYFVSPVACTAAKTTGSAQQQIDEFVARNMERNRPTSPHLTIYKPQLTSMLSITHRGTGIFLAAATSAFAAATLLGPETVDCITSYAKTMHDSTIGSVILYDIKFALSFPLVFHTINGLRHLMWDQAKGLTIDKVYQTGWVVLLLSTVLAALFPLMF